MKISAIILTFNRPDALKVILDSISRQYVLPHEVIIADDGSGKETSALITGYRETFPVPLKHVWHKNDGYRIAAIRNKAVRESTGDFLIFSDGDLVLHPKFFYDFQEGSTSGTALIGSRVFLRQDATEKILLGSKQIKKLTFFSDAIEKNRLNAVRLPLLGSIILSPRHPEKLRGGLMGVWKSDLLAVNGWNESFTGWGREDTELVIRLSNSGIKMRKLKFAAISWHLWHEAAERTRLAENEDLLKNTLEKQLKWCQNGLSKGGKL